METTLNANALAFVGLCKEYCEAVENAAESEREEFVDTMLRLLPRLYITASDLRPQAMLEDVYAQNYLDEYYYDSVRRNMETLMGEDDTYLEVFEEDMKYSDTPVAASIAEGLADIFQALYNFLHPLVESPDADMQYGLAAVHDEFRSYWSGTLCNVLRAINHLKYNSQS